MANDNHASYFRIGLIVILGVLAIVGTLVYIGGLGGGDNEMLAETYYDKPVSGLSVGSVVNCRGVKIGEVREVGFIGAKYDVEDTHNSRIYILMALDRRLLGVAEDEDPEQVMAAAVKAGLRATVTASGITGLSRIECDYYPDEPQRTLPITWTPRNLCIPPRVSLLDSFSESATKVMNQINKMDLNAFWSNVHATVESFCAATASTRHMLESYQPELERTMRNLEDATASLRVFAETIKNNPATLLRGTEAEPLPETTEP